ncbi:nucleoside phosphorylase [Desulfosalsimonas propionicica]|uniref:Nucleoside phosphorylase n=1 Tax=Desulfosalsimonas propionicica TaxID=332175 RepID=A0A7W0HLF4_9BACT|nr:hypothetical protein [Desulfosalsimonas propionicica]MBA2882258.1 nucleoside phosphorylase [Desulfosalsimonas propionicica]
MSKHHRIGLIMATYIEAKPFVEKINWLGSEKKPFPVYYGNRVILVVSGMGKANAAAACAWLCVRESVQSIVNTGAAGANQQGLPPGGIHHISEALETDRRHFKTNEPFCHKPSVMEGFSTLRLATREEAVIDPDQRRQTAAIAELSDMEGAAVVQIANRFEIPCFLFKFISDTPEDTQGSRIVANIRQYRDLNFDFFTQTFLQ